MKYYDFEYDGLLLSNFGFILCEFDGGGELQSVTNGSRIGFHTVPVRYGQKRELTASEYDECLEADFQICKDPSQFSDAEITISELRELTRWLNRRSFHKLQLLGDPEMADIYFEASFNIQRLELNAKTYGLELHMTTNRPFAVGETQTITIENTVPYADKHIGGLSDEEGVLYPYMEITVLEDGDLHIANETDAQTMTIRNCTEGEVITLDYPYIETTDKNHRIQNDFNWNFFCITNAYRNASNRFTVSLKATLKFMYKPIVKIGI